MQVLSSKFEHFVDQSFTFPYIKYSYCLFWMKEGNIFLSTLAMFGVAELGAACHKAVTLVSHGQRGCKQQSTSNHEDQQSFINWWVWSWNTAIFSCFYVFYMKLNWFMWNFYMISVKSLSSKVGLISTTWAYCSSTLSQGWLLKFWSGCTEVSCWSFYIGKSLHNLLII